MPKGDFLTDNHFDQFHSLSPGAAGGIEIASFTIGVATDGIWDSIFLSITNVSSVTANPTAEPETL